MKHDFCLAGLLTYLGLLRLPTLVQAVAGDLSKLNLFADEAHSNGTVQDFHLIPFSSVPSQWRLRNKTMQRYKILKRNASETEKIFMVVERFFSPLERAMLSVFECLPERFGDLVKHHPKAQP